MYILVHRIFRIENICLGKPEPVFNCTLYNVTSTSVRVSCLSGADNGAPQQFALQV